MFIIEQHTTTFSESPDAKLKTNYPEIPDSSFCVGLFILFEELLQEFDVFIGHICEGVGVVAEEVDEPYLRYNFCGLGLDGLQVTLAEPAVDGVIGIAGGGDDLLDGECIGDGFEFLFEPGAEV